MAIVYMADGEERFIEDNLLSSINFEPLKKRQLRDQLQSLRVQRGNFPALTNAELVDWAKLNHHTVLARNQINDQIDRLVLELAQWP